MKKMSFVILSLLLFILTGCFKNESNQIEEEFENEKKIPVVRVETVSPLVLHETCSTNGNVRVIKSVDVYPQINGRVVSSPVKMGQRIRKGDVLAVIDPSVNGGRYSLHEIRSPIDGNLLNIPVQTGTVLTVESKFAVVGDLSEFQVVAYVPERFYSFLKPGIKADVCVETYGDEKFSAYIREVSPVIDEDSRTTEIILSFSDRETKICAGMYADITLYLKAHENVISVPASCIFFRGDEKLLFVVEDGKSRMKSISTGMTLNNRTIITDGLQSGELVVLEGVESLSDGEEINVIAE